MKRNLSRLGGLSVVSCLLLALFVSPALGRWAKTFGPDEGITGILAPSVLGGYYLGGYTESGSESTWNVARLDSSGNVTLAKKLLGTGDNFSVAWELSDGSFFVQGETTRGTGRGTNALWAKFTSSFSPVWAYAFGGDGDEYLGFAPTKDGGFIGGGLSGSYGSGDHMLVIKLNSSGAISWSTVLSIADSDKDFEIIEITGGYLMSTTFMTETMGIPDGGQDIVLIKLNTSGAVQWARRYEAEDKSINTANVSETSDENILVACSNIPTFSFPSGVDPSDFPIPTFSSNMLLMKVSSSDGSILWDWKYGDGESMVTGGLAWENSDGTFSYSGFKPEMDYGSGISVQDGGDLEVKGNIIMLKVSSTGTINSQKMTTNNDILGFFFRQHDGTYNLLGSQLEMNGTETVVNVLYGVFDSSLNPVWVRVFGGDKTDAGVLWNNSGQYFLSGTTMSFDSGKSRIFGVTLDSTGGYPDCQSYFRDITITWGSPQLSATDAGWTAAAITPEVIAQPYSAESTTMTVEEATLSVSDICGSTPESVVYVGKSGCGGHSPCVSTISEGLASAEDNGTVKVGEGTYAGDLLMNVTKTLRVQGYDAAYANPSTPGIQGSLTIGKGKLIFDKGGFALVP